MGEEGIFVAVFTPDCATQELDVRPFAECLQADACGYDADAWLYVPSTFLPYRYVLGKRCDNPLICIGINPSTADPTRLDPTLQSVERIARNNGFDGFMMMNVYAQRATIPNDLDRDCNPRLHAENLEAFRHVLSLCDGAPTIWAGWGTLIEKRPYLFDCLRDMIAVGQEYGARWVTAGKRSKAGHPHHPLYLRADSLLEDFDVEEYLNARP